MDRSEGTTGHDSRPAGVRLVEQHCLGIGNWWTLRDAIDGEVRAAELALRDRLTALEEGARGLKRALEGCGEVPLTDTAIEAFRELFTLAGELEKDGRCVGCGQEPDKAGGCNCCADTGSVSPGRSDPPPPSWREEALRLLGIVEYSGMTREQAQAWLDLETLLSRLPESQEPEQYPPECGNEAHHEWDGEIVCPTCEPAPSPKGEQEVCGEPLGHAGFEGYACRKPPHDDDSHEFLPAPTEGVIYGDTR